MNKLLLPICWIFGHDRPMIEDTEWFATNCVRCSRPFGKLYIWQIIRYKIPYIFLWLANKTSYNHPTYKPQFRAIDQQIKGIGTEHSCAAYSYEGIVSLLKQYRDDGLPDPLLKDLISEEGWVNITEDNAEEVIAMINEDFEKQSNKAERERTMKLMNGEEVRKGYE